MKVECIVNKCYDNKFHNEHIVATDVTYIIIPKYINQKNVYLYISISHKMKEVLLWHLTKSNNLDLAKNSFDINSNDNAINHSVHGSIYSLKIFTEFINKRKWKQ